MQCLPNSKNHFSTYTKSQHLPRNTTAIPYQTNTTLRWNTHTYLHHQIKNHRSSKRSSPSPSLLLTPHTTTHLPYHIPSPPTHKTHTGITYQSSSTLAPQSSHTCHQHKSTFMDHTKKGNHITKTTLTNTTQTPQHPFHNTRHKHNQTFYRLQYKHNQTNTIKLQHITTSTNNIASKSLPMPLLFRKKMNPAIIDLLLQRGW